MSVEIWATITHLGDSYFCSASEPSGLALDLLVSESLMRKVRHRQTWIVDSHLQTMGGVQQVARTSYGALRQNHESYLALLTPGYVDVILNSPREVIQKCTVQICRMARIFNKKLIYPLIGYPDRATAEICEKLSLVNSSIKEIVANHGGIVCDLSGLRYTSLTEFGSRPLDMTRAAEIISESVIDCHAMADEWKRIQTKSISI